jgi:hypothetical protein
MGPLSAKNASKNSHAWAPLSYFLFLKLFLADRVSPLSLASIPKQRVSMFRLNRNKQKTNRNSLIGSIFCNFYRKFMVFRFFRFFSVFSSVFSVFFSVFSVCFETVCSSVSVVSLLYQNREFR